MSSRVKIYQNVAAKQQVNMRDGRIRKQVAAAEDDHAADIARHAHQALTGEVFFFYLRTHAAQRFRRILRPAGNIQRAFVIIRGINLDLIFLHSRTQQLTQLDGN